MPLAIAQPKARVCSQTHSFRRRVLEYKRVANHASILWHSQSGEKRVPEPGTSGFAETPPFRTSCRIYINRIADGDRHHCHSGGPASARFVQRAISRQASRLFEQPEAI